MRLIVLIVGGVATGALAGGTLQSFAPPNDQMLVAVRALGGGDATSIKITDFNPLKAYEYVRQQITSGEIDRSLNLRTTKVPTISDFKLGTLGAGSGFHIDNAQAQRGWADSIGSQIHDSNRRMEDMAAYTRNPSAWRGLPPH